MKCPFAIWRPGPKWKVGYAVFGRTSDKHGVVDHSADGPLNAALAVLDGWRTASWQFTNDDSALYQHYEIEDVCWHAGFEANKQCVGVENTGKDEPLTSRQYDHLLALHIWLREQGVLTVCERRVDLWEHNEWMNTDCPSGRIPWDRLIADLKEEEMPPFTDEQERRIKDIIAFGVPGLEMSARMAVTAAFEAGASFAKMGQWNQARATLAIIEQRMKDWHRWQE